MAKQLLTLKTLKLGECFAKVGGQAAEFDDSFAKMKFQGEVGAKVVGHLAWNLVFQQSRIFREFSRLVVFWRSWPL